MFSSFFFFLYSARGGPAGLANKVTQHLGRIGRGGEPPFLGLGGAGGGSVQHGGQRQVLARFSTTDSARFSTTDSARGWPRSAPRTAEARLVPPLRCAPTTATAVVLGAGGAGLPAPLPPFSGIPLRTSGWRAGQRQGVSGCHRGGGVGWEGGDPRQAGVLISAASRGVFLITSTGISA